MEKNEEEPKQDLHFPDKPSIAEKEAVTSNTVIKSIASIALFVLAFYLLFDADLKFILILVVVIFIHEMGHLLAMKIFNYKDVKMFFIPLLGALATGKKNNVSQKQNAIILLAGPVPGILIGIIMYYLSIVNNSPDLEMTANIFIFLNMFNLLPLTPLDGGQLIGTLFFTNKEKLRAIFTILSAAGLAIIAISLEEYFLLIIPIFLLIGLTSQGKSKKIRKALDQQSIDYEKPFEELTSKEYWLIRDQIVSNYPHLKLQPGNYAASSKENSIINLITAILTTKPIVDLSGMAKAILVGIWLLFFVGPFIALGLMYTDSTPEQAIADYTEAIELDPDNAMAYNNRGLVYYNLGDLEQAIRDYTKAIELDSKFALAYSNRGFAYYHSGDLEQAISDFNKAIELDPGDAEAYNNRGFAYYESRELEKAIADYTKTIELDSNDVYAYNSRGLAYKEFGDLEKAIADYSTVIELDPDVGMAYINRGSTYDVSGDPHQAIRDYTKAIALEPDLALAYYNRGKAYYNSGNFEKAIRDHNKAIEIDTGYAVAYTDRGTLYADIGDLEQAIADHTRAIQLDADLALAYYNRGKAYAKLEDLEQAIQDFTKAIELDPADPEAYNNRGISYSNSGNLGKAIADYTNAIELDSNYTMAYHNRVIAYYNSGDLEEAIADYERYLELAPYAPDREEVLKSIEKLKSQLGE